MVGFLSNCTLLVLPTSAECQEGADITTDRPDFVESSKTVGKGHFQVETSLSWERADNGMDGDRYTTPTLLRYGIYHNWEIRLETEGVVHSNNGAGSDQGFADISLGVKSHIRDGEPSKSDPSIGWLFHVDVPSGSKEFQGHGLRPSIRIVFEWTVLPMLALGVMPGIKYDTDDNEDRFASSILGVVFGQPWSDRFNTFGEIAFRQLTSERHGGNVISYTAGMAFRLKSNVQIDTALSIGVNDTTPDWSWTAGFSILL
jgi:hypothetical protein